MNVTSQYSSIIPQVGAPSGCHNPSWSLASPQTSLNMYPLTERHALLPPLEVATLITPLIPYRGPSQFGDGNNIKNAMLPWKGGGGVLAARWVHRTLGVHETKKELYRCYVMYVYNAL